MIYMSWATHDVAETGHHRHGNAPCSSLEAEHHYASLNVRPVLTEITLQQMKILPK